jgi:hypothetical protein
VLAGESGEQRAERLRFFVGVGERSHALQNYIGVAAILTGLAARSINATTLPHAWSLLTDVDAARLKDLAALVSSTNGFAVYREQLRQTYRVSSIVPFFAVFNCVFREKL